MKEVKVRYAFAKDDEYMELWQTEQGEYVCRYICGPATWMSVCDPMGYCELNDSVKDVRFIICDQWFEPLAEQELPTWHGMTLLVRDELQPRGVMPWEKQGIDEVLRPMWEEHKDMDCYYENCRYNRWRTIGKARPVHRYEWAGMRCYVMEEVKEHKYLPVRIREWYVMCPTKRGLKQSVIGREVVVDECIKPDREYLQSLVRKPFSWFNMQTMKSVKSTDWSGVWFPRLSVYREFCRRHGLRSIEARADGRRLYTAPFVVKDLPYSTEERPEGFVPYPVMSNGDARMGGYRVDAERGVIEVYRPNPNWHEPWDGVFDGVDYRREGDDYLFRAWHRFAEEHVTF